MLLTSNGLVCRHWQRQCLFQSKASIVLRHGMVPRLLSSLAILEQRGGRLEPASLSAVTAAQKLGGSITGFVAGSNIRAVADEAAKVKGMNRIIMVENDSYDKVLQTSTQHNPTRPYANFSRVCPRTTLLCLWRTSGKRDSAMCLQVTQHLART